MIVGGEEDDKNSDWGITKELSGVQGTNNQPNLSSKMQAASFWQEKSSIFVRNICTNILRVYVGCLLLCVQQGMMYYFVNAQLT